MANGILLNIDTTKSEFQNPMVQLRQGDGNYQSLDVTVTSNGEPLDLTGWMTMFMGTTAGGFKIVDSAVTVTNALQGEFTYTPTKAWGQDQGEFKNAYFKFTKAEETASGASFRVNVLDAVDLTAEEAGNYISVVDVMIDKIKTDMDNKLADTQKTLSDTQSQATTVQGNVNDLNNNVNELKSQNNNIKTTDNTWTGTNTFNKKIIAPAGVQGNSDTATKIQTPRKINGVDFDGTSDININLNYLSVKDFGAVGDGTTDDTSAINNALSSNLGGVVYLEPNKTYLISDTIKIKGGTTFNGNMSTILLNKNVDYAVNATISGGKLCNFWIKKTQGVIASAIYVYGSANILENIHSRNQIWETFIHAVDLKESHFSHIRVDNDTTNKTGIILNYEHCINNTITTSFFGYSDIGILIPDIAAITGHYTEGLLISDTSIVMSNTAIDVRHGTAINVSNSILDFCQNYGVKLYAGQMFTMSNTWVAVVNDNATIISIANSSDDRFNEYLITNNMFVGGTTNTGQRAFNIPGNSKRVVASGNILQSIPSGTIFAKNAYLEGNLTSINSPINGYEKIKTSTFYPTNTVTGLPLQSAFELLAQQMGTNNILSVFGNISSSGVMSATIINSKNISLSNYNSTNKTLSVVTADGVYSNMMIVLKVYPVDHLTTR